MFRHKSTCCRLLRQCVLSKRQREAYSVFRSFQNRSLSSKHDLFTMDLDIDMKSTENEIRSESSPRELFKPMSQEPGQRKSTEKIANFDESAENDAHYIDDEKSGTSSQQDKEYLNSILADIVLEAPDQPRKDDAELDSIFGDFLAEKPFSESSRDALFDRDFADFDISGGERENSFEPSEESSENRVLADEKELFEKIFATYSQTEDVAETNDKLPEMVLSNLRDSFSTVNKSPQPVSQATETLSTKETNTIEETTTEALEKTLHYIGASPNMEGVVDFARTMFDQFPTKYVEEQFFLHKRKGEPSDAYLERHVQLSEEIRIQSEESPEKPVLNAFTMPVLFNHVISVLCTQHHDGGLALSLFNSTKENLLLYTTVCNQRTYNEMLKVHWIFYGKRSLCEIELIYVEMLNNGFAGDIHTFVIMKQILNTYYSMKAGKSNFNPGGFPVWSKEDEKRARNLTSKLEVLGKRLHKEKFFSRSYHKSDGRKRR
ncbi:hypothetical protein OXX59_001498 [Metschnikowia pulcherrima]